MRAILVTVLLVLVLVAVGWITFTRTPEKASIHVETQQIETDTQEAFDASTNLAREAGDALTRDDAATQPVQTIPTEPTQPVVPPTETTPESADPVAPPGEPNPAEPPQPVTAE